MLSLASRLSRVPAALCATVDQQCFPSLAFPSVDYHKNPVAVEIKKSFPDIDFSCPMEVDEAVWFTDDSSPMEVDEEDEDGTSPMDVDEDSVWRCPFYEASPPVDNTQSPVEVQNAEKEEIGLLSLLMRSIWSPNEKKKPACAQKSFDAPW